MNDLLFGGGDGQTLLSEEAKRGLKLGYVSTRGELNEAEQANMLRGLARSRRPTASQLLDDLYLRRLHRRMFGEVWGWAGSYRTTETNIGIAHEHVAAAVRNLVADASVWIGAGEEADVVATRFHHRLVQIHPFVNGNGRHGRVAADYLVTALGRPAFTWGADLGGGYPALRGAYLGALRTADGGDLGALLDFVRG